MAYSNEFRVVLPERHSRTSETSLAIGSKEQVNCVHPRELILIRSCARHEQVYYIMMLIEIKTNDFMELTGRFVVSNATLKKVERLSELGGYDRFHLNFIEYVNEPTDSFTYIEEWLSYNVFCYEN